MFRPKSQQLGLLSGTTFMSAEKLRRLQDTWAWAFRTSALPLIDEEAFRTLYDAGNGRPNKPVQTLIGLLLLKEMWDLTDDEALARLEFDLAWQAALCVDLDEAHCCQKTLHNFRVKLMANDLAQQLFCDMAERIRQALGISTDKQRLDSTHIVSNIARLTRLGLFCETIQVFLLALKAEAAARFESIPQSLVRRYVKEDGRQTRFGDASSRDSHRRLGVCARDVWRLVDRFRGDEQVAKMESFGLLERLLADQCEVVAAPVPGAPGDEDVQEPPVPVAVKEAKTVKSDSLQTPHDPDVTYSGHKGKGYEVQVAETHGNEGLPELITHVEVTRSCDSDDKATVHVVKALDARGLRPKELEADTAYGSTDNVLECQKLGTELVSPVAGSEAEAAKDGELRKADFVVDAAGEHMTTCPVGRVAVSESRDTVSGRIRAVFDGAECERCERRDACPARRLRDGTRVYQTTVKQAVVDQRRRYEQTEEFRARYSKRANIEATNAELKGRHGLGDLRVRGKERVRLAVYLKATACNVKRLVLHLVNAAARAARAMAAAVTEETEGAACRLLRVIDVLTGWLTLYALAA